MKVVLMFSEGAHDVAFLKLILEWCLNIKHIEKAKISEFPNPLNEYFQSTMKNYAMGDLTLDMANKFFLPNLVFKTDNAFILLFNSGGEKKIKDLKPFLGDLFSNLEIPNGAYDFTRDDLYLFFSYDADENAPHDVITKMNKLLFPIKNTDSIIESEEIEKELYPLQNLEYEDCSAKKDKLFFYVWTKNNKSGTLEDILLPIFAKDKPDLIKKSNEFVNKNFSKLVYSEPVETKDIPKKANNLKATYTIAGQGEKPERPLSAILMDHVLCEEITFTNDPKIKEFCEFLKQIIY